MAIITEADIQNVKLRFGIIGNASLLNQALRRAVQVAETELTVLITGESGSGKESFAKIIHELSPRKHKQIIAINCGAIPAGTIYSELFGHEKGAFTGSTDMRKGYFETADGGTIFLDEIGEMPFDTQAMLLRVLENGEFIRMGSSKPLKTNVRVVAATNVDLLKAVETRKFREDLYYRLSTVPIFVPSLRERGDDVILLFRKFATDFAERYHSKPISLGEDAKELLRSFRFPGNIRQLKNVAEQISLLESTQQEISAATLRSYLPFEAHASALVPINAASSQFENPTEREILYKILFDVRNDVTELKKLVLQLIRSGSLSGETLAQHAGLFANLDLGNTADFVPAKTDALVLSSMYAAEPKAKNVIEISPEVPPKPTTHDITHEEESDTLSLEEKEKELIRKALHKNRNRRKNAARDLGISERTLYRKIKQYDLEDLK